MTTLKLWEVRAESGTKHPHLDVAATVAAENFDKAKETLLTIIEEKVSRNNNDNPEAETGMSVAQYEILCVRLLQEVITAQP